MLRLTGREKRFLVVIAMTILLFSGVESVITNYRLGQARGLEEDFVGTQETLRSTVSASPKVKDNLNESASQPEVNTVAEVVPRSLSINAELKNSKDDTPLLEVSVDVKSDKTTVADKADISAQDTKAKSQDFTINLNTAVYEELINLPGIGPVLAERILSYRLEKGKFLSIDELMEVKGIGEKLLAQIRPYLTL